jgi:hypothetical protein
MEVFQQQMEKLPPWKFPRWAIKQSDFSEASWIWDCYSEKEVELSSPQASAILQEYRRAFCQKEPDGQKTEPVKKFIRRILVLPFCFCFNLFA